VNLSHSAVSGGIDGRRLVDLYETVSPLRRRAVSIYSPTHGNPAFVVRQDFLGSCSKVTVSFTDLQEGRFEDETIWLSQVLLADLFQVTVPNINIHIKSILFEGELTEGATIKDYLIVRLEGAREVQRQVKYYSLDMILAIGYRIRSDRGTAFRQWATARLKEYLVKGFVLDDARLKNPPGPGVPDYFDEMLERIRDIRASEKRMYLQVRDIFALAADYQPVAAETQQFFQIIQNKLHWAATGKTAAELIAELNRIVTMYLDYAEDQARRRNVLYMRDWREKLDAFLQFNERDILTNAGGVAKEVADRLAVEQYDQFHARRLIVEAQADERAFEDAVKKLPAKKLPKAKGKS